MTAHLDSAAAFHEPYDPATDPAPGADDDASGVAAVLAIAERFAALAADHPPGRTVRFVLFNAEEQGLVGSRAYARRSKARGEAIAAVWQMDMIGFNATPPRTWEVHAGFEPSAAVEARSRQLADLLQVVTEQAAPGLPPPQIYHSGTQPDGDPAAGRSDQASFHAHGYPACVASEDFFIDDGPDPGDPDVNPNYHTPGDRVIDPAYAADIARAVAAAAWLTANEPAPPVGLATAFSPQEQPMPSPRDLDTRTRMTATPAAGLAGPAATTARSARTNALTGSPAVVPAAPADRSLVDRALAFVQRQPTAFGARAGDVAEFVPDPLVQRTSAGAAAVNLKQTYRGLPVFQMVRTVRFGPAGQVVDAAGDTAPIPEGLGTEPRLAVEVAVLAAAKYLATTGVGVKVKDAYGQEAAVPAVDLKGFDPEVIAGFPLPARPTVLDKGPFENPIPAHLLVFNQPGRPRLAWHAVLTLPGYADQYIVVVAADGPTADVLYCKSTMHQVQARGRVYEFSPAADGSDNRRVIAFPRPLADYPVMPSMPLSGFPADWVKVDRTRGNSTRATLNFGTDTLAGVGQDGVIEFAPGNPTGNGQKLLNIFYFCNYMHDFLYILGFDEASGHFQQVNFTSTGAGGDPVRARAHSGPVSGTANMATGPDGLPPLMNMGLVAGTGRHTTFDANVVFHEYVHGLTNRLVGGRLDAQGLDKLQSGGMGEGWSDYFALTAQNFFRGSEKVVTGDWVVDSPGGIRRAPYDDDDYPFGCGDLAASPEVHDIGEVWCAALMMMTRKMQAALGSKPDAYRLSWTVVVGGLKLTPANPTFLDARDAILRALDDLLTAGRVPPATHRLARRAAWEAFARFGMGANAFSSDADVVDDIVVDTTIPPGV